LPLVSHLILTQREFGDAGLITYLINDAVGLVIILDITWAG
jgi:hypothetical protein